MTTEKIKYYKLVELELTMRDAEKLYRLVNTSTNEWIDNTTSKRILNKLKREGVK